MLINTIKFEIRNFKNGTAEQFLIENTELNYALIASRKDTRDIHFTTTFDFQFAHERKCPKFIEFTNAFVDAVVLECGTETLPTDVVDAIDEIDEMVGTF